MRTSETPLSKKFAEHSFYAHGIEAASQPVQGDRHVGIEVRVHPQDITHLRLGFLLPC